ncbi:transcriptional regulator [Acetobacter nitrogenifigens DSM 23921 = NBRC 105050]|uniref:MarR family transcriptional regulator n=1 Tax=Acetobacter nitrogenifigens DSM 23921 = NBRC 105050 TaxID=1120919 RepID=A0A511XEF5_9PROT|nr:MarR family transcriptional regulator [Acetobacter nitrogenifigens]GBQ88104.1 transcriptional regulator [Acetobacter nitrogenifigens DSM 23921 = NBRC 105050]GEN61271.1 MarR family transcriptional regulator [Acetobacter nitrogenifigens DSM 23921 = NBRC 105050]
MDPSPCPPPLDAHLCYAIYSANIAINRAYRPALERLGLTYPQYLVMSVLWERDGQSIGDIAGRLALESSTITPLVKRLEGAGFVRRERNPEDERQVIVTLSPQGVALRQDAACVGETLLGRSDLSIAELMRLNDEIRRFRDVLIANTPDAE